MAQMVLMRVLYIFHFSRMAAMNEYFVSTFLVIWNIFLILIFALIRIHSGEVLSNSFINAGKIHQGLDRTFHFFTVVFPMIICLIIILTGLILIGIKKYKSRMIQKVFKISPVIGQGYKSSPVLPFNNISHNENIVNFGGALTLTLVFISIALPTFLLTQLGHMEMRDLILFYLFVCYQSCVIIFPLVYFIKKPSRMRSVLEVLFC